MAAYTFDAGPNAVVYYEQEAQGIVLGGFQSALGGKDGWSTGVQADQAGSGSVERTSTSRHEGTRGGVEEPSSEKDRQQAQAQGPEDQKSYVNILRNGIKRVIHTSVGDGPVSIQEHLIDEYGNPLTT